MSDNVHAKKTAAQRLRKACVAIHRDLGYFFAGIVLIYAISGIAMNHRNNFNPNFSAETITLSLPQSIPAEYAQISEADIEAILNEADCPKANYTKHFKDGNGHLKVLIKGGSSIIADLKARKATYEKVTPRPVMGSLVKLHYNPGHWWTVFADIFASALILITLTGFFIITGKNGLKWRGAILLLLGLVAPLAFLLL